jgi:hypothetical protein
LLPPRGRINSLLVGRSPVGSSEPATLIDAAAAWQQISLGHWYDMTGTLNNRPTAVPTFRAEGFRQWLVPMWCLTDSTTEGPDFPVSLVVGRAAARHLRPGPRRPLRHRRGRQGAGPGALPYPRLADHRGRPQVEFRIAPASPDRQLVSQTAGVGRACLVQRRSGTPRRTRTTYFSAGGRVGRGAGIFMA